MEVTLKRCMFLRPMLPSAEQPWLQMFGQMIEQIVPTCPAESGKRRNECCDELEIFHSIAHSVTRRSRVPAPQKYALIIALAYHPTTARTRSQ